MPNYCLECGTEISNGDQFCGGCGKKITDKEEMKQELKEKIEEEVREELRDEVRQKLRDEVRNQVKKELRDEIKKEVERENKEKKRMEMPRKQKKETEWTISPQEKAFYIFVVIVVCIAIGIVSSKLLGYI